MGTYHNYSFFLQRFNFIIYLKQLYVNVCRKSYFLFTSKSKKNLYIGEGCPNVCIQQKVCTQDISNLCWSTLFCFVLYLMQMISWDDWGVCSSLSLLCERLSVCRFIRPHGTTEGRELRLLCDTSSTVILDETSRNQSSSNHGSFKPDHCTLTGCRWGGREDKS